MTTKELPVEPDYLGDVRALVFDLDGTLIDSADDIMYRMRHTFAELGVGALPENYRTGNLHGTTAGIMQTIAGDMGWRAPADVTHWVECYQRTATMFGHQSTKLYPGVLDVLQACRDRFGLAICTNKVHAGAISVTRHFGIHDYFDAISGMDTWPQAKPSPVPLLETIRLLGVSPAQCLYFGDTEVDAECAQRAGVRFVWHTAGYGGNAPSRYPCHHAFDRWGDLLAGLSVPSGRRG